MSPPGLRLRARRLGAVLAREGRRTLGLERTVYVDQRTDEYRGYWSAAAQRIGAELVPLSASLWEVRLGDRRTRICGWMVQADDPVTLRLAGDKALCLRMAADAGVPVPEHHAFTLDSLDRARRIVLEDAGPWVVKPVRGSASGLGVTTGVTAGEVDAAAVRASLHGPDLLLERMVPGESCRLLYLDGELIHAVRRRGIRLRGDGRTDVRGLARAAGLIRILADPMVSSTLAAQALTMNAVPGDGREILLRGIPRVSDPGRELRTVYDEPITALIHPATAAALAEVVRRAGSRFAGVDIVTVDPARPLAETGGAFLELNTTPGIHHHYHTQEDRGTHPVAVRVLRRLLGADAPAPAAAPCADPDPPRSTPMTTRADAPPAGRLHTADYLRTIGVRRLAPALSPFDPGYDPATVESHLEQSHHLMSLLKISMACWLIADEGATRRKLAAARRWNVPVVTGGGPFEVAVQQGALPAYLDLCADLGVRRVECGEGFTDLPLPPEDVVRMIHARGMEAQFELGKKHGGAFTRDVVDGLIDQGRRWLDAGAVQLVVEGRESARGVGLFDDEGRFNADFAERFAAAFGLETLIFEAPNKPSQFALLDHFGTGVHLCNVRLEEVLRVEIYRRGLHSDAFANPRLRPPAPVEAELQPAGVVRFAGINGPGEAEWGTGNGGSGTGNRE